MKKVFGGTLILLLVVAGGFYYLYSNLEYFVKRQIETAGTAAAGSAVTVDDVLIDPGAGSATIRGFRVANPEGYSDADMLSFSELNVILDLANLSRARVGIVSIVARRPHVLYEMKGNVSNLDVIREKLAAQGHAPATAANPGADIHLDIARVDIEEIRATLSSTMLENPVEVNLGNINLRDLGGTPDEIAGQIMRPVLAQISNTAARALLSRRAGDLRDDVLDRIDAGLEAAGETVRNRLGDLLKSDSDEDVAPPVQP